MALLSPCHQTNLICVLIVLTLMLIGNVKSQTIDNDKAKIEIKTPALVETLKEQKSVKKELKENITQDDNVAAVGAILPTKNDGHAENVIVIGAKSATETKGLPHQEVVINAKETIEKKKEISSEKLNDKTNTSQPPITTKTTTKSSSPVQHFHHDEEEFLLNDEDDISDSLKTGFYFFLALSSGAVLFILFKIYRLRLSRAERKYGVQGDRSNQELTPLPISIEDCNSDDEDQTLFEIQRQNIRIL